MRRLPRRILVVFLPLLPGAAGVAQGQDGRRCLLDRVGFEPDAAAPERMQLWGVFVVALTFTLERCDHEDRLLGLRDEARLHVLHAERHGRRRGAGGMGGVRSESGHARRRRLRCPLSVGAGDAAAGECVPDQAEIEALERYNGPVRVAADATAAPDLYPRCGEAAIGAFAERMTATLLRARAGAPAAAR